MIRVLCENGTMSGEDVEKGNEDSIKVVARFRPLNDSEERAGSKFIVTFPHSKDDAQVSIGVSRRPQETCGPALCISAEKEVTNLGYTFLPLWVWGNFR